jgi:hypothetical protein
MGRVGRFVVAAAVVSLSWSLGAQHTHLHTMTGLIQPLQYHVLSASVNAQRDLHAGFTTVVDLMSHGGWYGTVDLKNAITRMSARSRKASSRTWWP